MSEDLGENSGKKIVTSFGTRAQCPSNFSHRQTLGVGDQTWPSYVQLDFLSMRARGWSSTRAVGDFFCSETSFENLVTFRTQALGGKK